MKKIILLTVCLGFTSLFASAGEYTGIAEYFGSNKFHQIKAQALWQFSLNWMVGLEGKYANEDVFKDPVYALKLPFGFSSELFSFHLTPFYYFKNKSDNALEYKAFGISGKMVLTLEDDAVNELYSHAYVSASFARQQGLVGWADGNTKEQYYSQAAYSLGLHKNFFRAFSFEAMGSVFQYPDGISKVDSFRGILDQQDLAAMQTYEIVHDLPKYTAGARLTRLWADRKATLFGSYRFGELYTADPEHSVVVGNSFALADWAQCSLGYNHLRTVHNKNKRDIFYAQLRFIF